MAPQAQPEGVLNGSTTVYQDLSVYPISIVLNSTALLDGRSYYITVRAGTAYPLHPATTLSSPAIMVRRIVLPAACMCITCLQREHGCTRCDDLTGWAYPSSTKLICEVGLSAQLQRA